MLEGTPSSQSATPAPSWAILLEQFYSRSGHPFPRIRQVVEGQMPEPYRGLLVHGADMTPTLEKFYHQTLGITVLNYELQPSFYLREVVLTLPEETASDGHLRPIEYGVIRIFLNRLSPAARRKVLDQQRPFGTILREEAVPHNSWPQGFFRIESEERLASLLRTGRPCELYGRRNILLDDSRHALAEVIEILAPVDGSDPTS